MSVGTSLVRLALASHLDTYRHPRDGLSGRQTLARRMDVPPSGITDRFNGRAPALLELVREAGRHRVVPSTELEELARQVGVDPDPYSWTRQIDMKLWDELRDANGLGIGRAPAFRAPIDVTLASAALVARYPGLTDRTDHRPVKLAPEDLAAAQVLTEALCRICSRPYGRRTDAFGPLAVLAPVTIDTISACISSSPVGSNVVRAIDRALRLGVPRATFNQAVQRLIANPPVLLFRNALWMRAVRRVMWVDRHQGREPVKRWALEQALRGAHGDGAYAWSGTVERRYALWVFSEFSRPDDTNAWDRVRREAVPFGSSLLADLEQVREHLANDQRERRRSDLFYFRPPGGWTLPPVIAELLREHLSLGRTESARSIRQRGWTDLRPVTRRGARELILEALIAPCAIRHRTAVDTLKASSPILRHGVGVIVGDVLSSCMDERGEIEPTVIPVVERCVNLLGALSTECTVPVLNEVLRKPALPATVAKVAILAAGNLAQAFPDEAPGLIAWACDLARKTPTDPLVSAAVYSCVLAGRDPATHLADHIPSTGGSGRAAMFEWAATTLRDPLRPEISAR